MRYRNRLAANLCRISWLPRRHWKARVPSPSVKTVPRVLQSVFAFLFGYVCGAIPFGLIFTRAAGTPDLRAIGSGNIGATNVLRTGRKDLAALTLLLDLLKGTAAVLTVAHYARGTPMLLAAQGAFLGHLFPVWLQFRGGKGVATFLGCLLGIAWQAGVAFAIVWLAVAFLTRTSSAAALAASALTPVVLVLMARDDAALMFGLMAILLWAKHRGNIGRLLAGSEPRIGMR
jgi:acyl phosphate:glycerol-3-phosphate acyltransferase